MVNKQKYMYIISTFISRKTKTPRDAVIIPGPVDIMGNAIACDSTLFATNQHDVATPHITPDAKPGIMILG